jgi:hypothetical protein
VSATDDLIGVATVFKKMFMPDDPGFFFDFGVGLPTPTSGDGTFFPANFCPMFDVNSDPSQ